MSDVLFRPGRKAPHPDDPNHPRLRLGRYMLPSQLPAVPPVLSFLQQAAELSTEEAYGTLNMGAGFALYLPAAAVEAAVTVGKRCGFELLHAGAVEAGAQRVVIEPLGIIFEAESLQVQR